MLAPGTRVDRYVVESVLGRGGMAVVYKVRHADLGTWHALKVLNALDPIVRDRLAREGRVQGTLRHPNVVAVTDLVEINGQSALVMELVDGPALDVLLDKHRLTLDQADALVHGLLLGVMHAHRHGFVHRDLKPANVLLAPSDDGLVPKVADFGLAKLLLTDVAGPTRTGVMMGTPAYMAPEQIRDSKSVDQRADVFSLGVVLYEVVLGRRPFDGTDVMEILQGICAGRYERPTDVFPGIPPRMADAITGALEVRLEDRIPDVATLLDVWQGRAKRPIPSQRSMDAPPEDLLPLPDWAPAAASRTQREMPVIGELRIATSRDGTPVPKDLDAIDPSRSGDHLDLPRDFRAQFPWLGVGIAVLAVLTLLGGAAWKQGWLPAYAPADAVSTEAPAVAEAPVPSVEKPRPTGRTSRPAPAGTSAAPAAGPATAVTPVSVASEPGSRPFDEVGLSDRQAVAPEDLRPAADAEHAVITVDGALGRLVRGDAVASPGEQLPPGRWTVEVAWDDHTWQKVGTIDALAGEVVAVRCRPSDSRCDGPLDMDPVPR